MEEGASIATGNGVHPLFTQPQMEDEDSSTNIDTNNKDDGACDTKNNDIEMDDNDEEDGSTNGPIFEIDEEDNMDSRVDQDDDDDDDDGFKLLTQANDRFNETVDGVASSSSDESSSDDSDSSGSSSDDDDSESSSSTGEKAMKNEKVETPLQERRARNMRRNKAFVDNLKLELNAMMNQGIDGGHKSSKRKRKVAAKDEESVTLLEQDVDEKDAPIERRKRRGMIFSTTTSNKRHNKSPQQIPLPLTTKSLVDELNPKYPHRSNQIQVLCSQLVSIVQKSKFAWQMKDNIRSLGNIQYSEASYQGDIKLATPSPIMITGNGGNGKTCIVRDAMTILQQRANCGNVVYPTVANAYIDCASSESGSVAAVMNSAYKQLHECYHSNSGFGRDEKVELKGYKHHSSAGIARSTLGGENDFTEDVVESDAADDESLGEDQLERQRSRAQKMKETAGRNGKRSKHNTKTNGNATKVNSNNTQNVRQTRLRTTLATKAANQPTSQSIGLNSGSIPSATNRNTQNSGSVALFGRATSALIQAGNTTRKRTSNNNWRCVFLILDNAERILSWKKHGSINPLTQIFLLPSVMGINLTLIFISRSTIFQHSRESCI